MRYFLVLLILALTLASECPAQSSDPMERVIAFTARDIQDLEPWKLHEYIYDKTRECVENYDREISEGSSFALIRWYQAQSMVQREGNVPILGLWVPPHSIILDRDFKNLPSLISHEIIHDLVPTAEHSDTLFATCIIY